MEGAKQWAEVGQGNMDMEKAEAVEAGPNMGYTLIDGEHSQDLTNERIFGVIVNI